MEVVTEKAFRNRLIKDQNVYNSNDYSSYLDSSRDVKDQRNKSDSGVDSMMMRTTFLSNSTMDERKMSEEDILNTAFLETTIPLTDSPLNNTGSKIMLEDEGNFSTYRRKTWSLNEKPSNLPMSVDKLKEIGNVTPSFSMSHSYSYVDDLSDDSLATKENKVINPLQFKNCSLSPYYGGKRKYEPERQLSSNNEECAVKNSLAQRRLYDFPSRSPAIKRLSPQEESLSSAQESDYPNDVESASEKFDCLPSVGSARSRSNLKPLLYSPTPKRTSASHREMRQFIHHNLSTIEEIDSVTSNSSSNTNPSDSKELLCPSTSGDQLQTAAHGNESGIDGNQQCPDGGMPFALQRGNPTFKSNGGNPTSRRLQSITEASPNDESVFQPLSVSCTPSDIQSPICGGSSDDQSRSLWYQSSSKTPSEDQSVFQPLTPFSPSIVMSKSRLASSNFGMKSLRILPGKKRLFSASEDDGLRNLQKHSAVGTSGISEPHLDMNMENCEQIDDEPTLTLVDFTVTKLDDASVMGCTDRSVARRRTFQRSQLKEGQMSESLLSFILHERSAMDSDD